MAGVSREFRVFACQMEIHCTKSPRDQLKFKFISRTKKHECVWNAHLHCAVLALDPNDTLSAFKVPPSHAPRGPFTSRERDICGEATVWISPEHTRRFFFYPSGVLVLPLTGHFIGWMADLGFDLFASSDHHFLKMPKWLSVWSLPPLFSNKFWGGCFIGFFVFLNYFFPKIFS